MSYALNLSSDYGYVLLTAAASIFFSDWLIIRVGAFRGAAKLPYPNPYCSTEKAASDPKAYAFNCAQRAHANHVDNYTPFLASLMISGIEYPKLAAAMGMSWLVARVVYSIGYTSSKMGDGGAGRRLGSFHYLPLLGLQLLAAWVGFNVLRAGKV